LSGRADEETARQKSKCLLDERGRLLWRLAYGAFAYFAITSAYYKKEIRERLRKMQLAILLRAAEDSSVETVRIARRWRAKPFKLDATARIFAQNAENAGRITCRLKRLC